MRVNCSLNFLKSFESFSQTIKLANSAPTINGKQCYAVNGVSYMRPSTPLQLADYYTIGGVYTVGDIADSPNGGSAFMQTALLSMEYRTFVEIVFQNYENKIQSWHLDAYSFFVVGNVEPEVRNMCTPIPEYNEHRQHGISRTDEPKKKTVTYDQLHEAITEVFTKLNYIPGASWAPPSKESVVKMLESDAVDPKSRHKGKLDTENLLTRRGINWTSLRPVYIYGPLNYNPVEEWFFHRLKAGRPIPVPNSGLQITQLGHVKDLARAFLMVLGNEKASKQVYNISGAKYVTFAGLAKACAKVAGFPEPEIVYFNPKEYDFGKKKSFPLRDQHFFTSIEKAQTDLGWKPEFDLIKGLADSYNLDFGLGKFRKEPDFSVDDMILNRTLVLQS